MAEIDVLPTTWKELWPHHSRGALLLVAPEADLNNLALAMATDDIAVIEGALAERRLSPVSDDLAEAWMQEPPAFHAVIVQPWVLAQILARPTAAAT